MTKRPSPSQTQPVEAPLDAGAARAITRTVARIGKVQRPAYQGARSYQLLPEDRG